MESRPRFLDKQLNKQTKIRFAETMNMNEIPTPESDVVWSEYLKSNYCTKDVEKLRKLHCDLERRLTIAREALEKCLGWTHRALELEISSSMSAAQCVDIKSAREALDLTAPKQ